MMLTGPLLALLGCEEDDGDGDAMSVVCNVWDKLWPTRRRTTTEGCSASSARRLQARRYTDMGENCPGRIQPTLPQGFADPRCIFSELVVLL